VIDISLRAKVGEIQYKAGSMVIQMSELSANTRWIHDRKFLPIISFISSEYPLNFFDRESISDSDRNGMWMHIIKYTEQK